MNEEHPDIKLTVAAASRHPEAQHAYDSDSHLYKREYVNPLGWDIILSGELPADAERCEYVVKQVDGDFEKSVAEWGTGKERVTIRVPRPGDYEIELHVRTDAGEEYTCRRDFTLRDYLLVALGDSYFCGEGNPDVPGEPGPIRGALACNAATFTKFLVDKTSYDMPMKRAPVWQERDAHRSYCAGPSIAARLLEDPENGRVVTFLNFARSGASIDEGLLNPMPDDDWTDIGQIEEARRTVGARQIDLLLLSVGGNDVGFSTRLIDLIREDLPVIGAGGVLGDRDLNRTQERHEAMRKLAAFPEMFFRLTESVRALRPKHVLVTEYPTAHFDIVDEDGLVVVDSGCGIFDAPGMMEIDLHDAEVVKLGGEQLNAALRKLTDEYGWTFVDGVADTFAGHGLCSDDKYFRSAQESCEMQGNFAGTMHPNGKGHAAYAEVIVAALREQLDLEEEEQFD